MLFDKLWVRRVPDTKWEAEHGQQVNVIASYVPRADYPELNQSAGPGGALLPCSNGVATRVATGFLAGKAISGLNESSAEKLAVATANGARNVVDHRGGSLRDSLCLRP